MGVPQFRVPGNPVAAIRVSPCISFFGVGAFFWAEGIPCSRRFSESSPGFLLKCGHFELARMENATEAFWELPCREGRAVFSVRRGCVPTKSPRPGAGLTSGLAVLAVPSVPERSQLGDGPPFHVGESVRKGSVTHRANEGCLSPPFPPPPENHFKG